jgi:hypothetical protein
MVKEVVLSGVSLVDLRGGCCCGACMPGRFLDEGSRSDSGK